jgi:dipeptidyl aminopeptidase/acylaminoacyl peptidase
LANVKADEFRSVPADLDRTPSRLGTPGWVDDGTLLCPFADEGWTRLVRLHVDGAPERVFEAQGRLRTGKQFDVGGGTVGVSLSASREGHDVFALDAGALDDGSAAADEASGPTRLSALDADLLDGAALPASRRVTYRNDDGVEAEAIAYLSEEFDAGDPDPRPTVVNVHGGPMSYDAPEFRRGVAYWTGQGYVVLKPNYRGSVPYGRAFGERLKGSRGDLEPDDVESGADALVERGRRAGRARLD